MARHIAKTISQHSAQLSLQHLDGEKNQVADLLSFAADSRGRVNPITSDDPQMMF